jgi:hypothetical protein
MLSTTFKSSIYLPYVNPNTKSIPLETGRSVKGKQKARFAKQITQKQGWQAIEKA